MAILSGRLQQLKVKSYESIIIQGSWDYDSPWHQIYFILSNIKLVEEFCHHNDSDIPDP
jgi:hypothetical protein